MVEQSLSVTRAELSLALIIMDDFARERFLQESSVEAYSELLLFADKLCFVLNEAERKKIKQKKKGEFESKLFPTHFFRKTRLKVQVGNNKPGQFYVDYLK